MLKRLRVKLVCILMAVVAVMLVIILGLVLHFTQQDLTQSSLQMLDKLRCRNGNLEITVSKQETSNAGL
ncbi:MAG: hypothetical protein ACOX8S_04935 [Christensenellales bacterium]|jgi:signal transduction histidine kinase